MNAEILECQKYLHPEQPVDVTSEDIKPYLQRLGWEEGDKIPSGMQEYTAAVLHILNKPVNMRSLPAFFEDETVIATLRSAINKVKVFLESDNQVKDTVNKLIPNPEELSPAARPTVMAIAETLVKHDLEEQAKKAIDTEEDLDGFSDVETTESTDKDADVFVNTEEIEELKKHSLCPRCLWDISKAYDPYPVTEDDKIAYVYSILGGTDFSKSYKVANNLLEITYTMPSSHVTRLIEDQVKIDGNRGRLYDTYQVYTNNNRYGLAASLTSVKALVGVDRNPPVPSLYDERFKDDVDTPLYKYTEFVEENIIKSGVRERYFRETYADFMRLCVHMMHTIDNENFSEAVLDKLS